MKLRLTYSKTGLIRFTSHRDLLRIFFRAFTRAGWPVSFSHGFSPHPKVEFCPPLKVGMEGSNELLNVNLEKPVEPVTALKRLNGVMPRGIRVKKAIILPEGDSNLAKAIREAEYRVDLAPFFKVTVGDIRNFLSATEIWVEDEREGEIRKLEVRKGVGELKLVGGKGRAPWLRLRLPVTGHSGPYPILAVLTGKSKSDLMGLRCRRLGFIGNGL